MTSRLMFEALLTELAKLGAPNMLLSDFNYFMNKAVNQYINKRYNVYDTSLLTTDDLRVLKATAILDAVPVYNKNSESGSYGPINNLSDYKIGNANLFGATYTVELPNDYLHMLNCVCIYRLGEGYKCWDAGNYIQFPAKRLTADAWSVIINDYYNRPLPERPYYYIHNVNTSSNELTPTNVDTDLIKPYNVGLSKVTTEVKYFDGDTLVYIKNGKVYEDSSCTIELPDKKIEDLKVLTITNLEKGESNDSNFPRVIQLNSDFIGESTSSVVERKTAQRYGNASKIRCEIRYGRDNSVFQLEKVFIDYIKTPLTIRLTLELVDLTKDTSLILEFPDCVCQEIVNELVTLVMENNTNQRIQTYTAVTLSIANPAQQLAPQQKS